MEKSLLASDNIRICEQDGTRYLTTDCYFTGQRSFNLKSPTETCPYSFFFSLSAHGKTASCTFSSRTWIKSRSLVMFHFAVSVLKLHGNNTLPFYYFAHAA